MIIQKIKKLVKRFKCQFRRIFTDVELLVAIAVHPHFKLGVVAYLNNELLCEESQLLEEISKNIPEGHAVTEVADTEDVKKFFKIYKD